MKGIILAGGSGTRLHPLTIATSKQLMPVYDKPMIYYPLSTLMLAGIRDVLIITTPHEADQFKRLLEDGSQWGVNISYAEQAKPEGIAQALLIGKDFIAGEHVALILGDNIFYGPGMGTALKRMVGRRGATVFAYKVPNPKDFGVISLDEKGTPISIEEKPNNPASNFVIPGLYFYDANVAEVVRLLNPSARGELEITDVHNFYLRNNKLNVEILDQEQTWLDAGTIDSLQDAAEIVRKIERIRGSKINVPEEIAFRLGYIDRDKLLGHAAKFQKSSYGAYLTKIAR